MNRMNKCDTSGTRVIHNINICSYAGLYLLADQSKFAGSTMHKTRKRVYEVCGKRVCAGWCTYCAQRAVHCTKYRRNIFARLHCDNPFMQTPSPPPPPASTTAPCVACSTRDFSVFWHRLLIQTRTIKSTK